MIGKIMKNDLKKNPGRNLILLLFIAFSAAVAVSVCLMLTQLFTAITSMYETANPPHFLQMHKGALNQEDIDEFNASYPGLIHSQTVPMINTEGQNLIVTSKDEQKALTDCKLDISLVKQNEAYDVLLDESGKPAALSPGEIGVPVILLDMYDIRIGDRITLNDGEKSRTFRVEALIRDAQMNSTMCSSTRFLISDSDFDALFETADETEYLIEAYFTDTAMASAYQTAYEQSEKNLPKDGQAVTYTMIFLLSALTDMMTAMIFLLAGIFLTVLALIALGYCLLTELEEDAKEIGTMKAIGISERNILRLYLGKIRIRTAAGCILGFALAVVGQGLLTGHMAQTFGLTSPSFFCWAAAAVAAVLLYSLVLLFARRMLKKLRAATVTDLLVAEKGFSKKRRVRDGLRKTRLPFHFSVGLHEARRGYGMIFILMILLSFLIQTTYRTADTMEDKAFVTYMGSPLCDVLLEAEQGAGLEKRKERAAALLSEEPTVRRVTALRRVRLSTFDAEGNAAGIHIDSGENAGTGLKYIGGGAPSKDDEIALSCLLAEELGKTVGDTMTLSDGETEERFTVCGVYPDVTAGGKTAKTIRAFPEATAEKYTFRVELAEGSDAKTVIESWRPQLGTGYNIEDMDSFLRQTLGGVSDRVKKAAEGVLLLSLLIAALMVLLFMKLRLARESRSIAVKGVLGLSFKNILLQEIYPILIAGFSGILLGSVLTELVGERLIGVLLELLGIGLKGVTFAPLPIAAVMGRMALLLAVAGATACLACRSLKKMKLSAYFNE